jgi:hypothetical protein
LQLLLSRSLLAGSLVTALRARGPSSCHRAADGIASMVFRAIHYVLCVVSADRRMKKS